MKTLKKVTAKNGNLLKFCTTNLIKDEHIIVVDDSCLMERTYFVGMTQELNDYKLTLIISKEQVMDAWIKGAIHF